MIQDLIDKINTELINLGYTENKVNSLPPIVNRINITINMAKLALKDNHKLTKEDKKWCEYYAQYNNMFDSDKLEHLGELYFELIEAMDKTYFK
ncbi:MAG: hypothetical protein WC044_05820 [Crocinitomicaceae bacterium]